MSKQLHSRQSALLLAAILLCQSHRTFAAAAENYLSALQGTIAQTRSNLATLATSAEHAANEFVSGGSLWVAGRQADFIAEACGRAGGLMAIAPLGRRVPTNNDVILYAVPGLPNPEDLKLIEQWRKQGATVVEFSSHGRTLQEPFPYRHRRQRRGAVDMDGGIRSCMHAVRQDAGPLPKLWFARRS